MGNLINMNKGGASSAPRRTFGGGNLLKTNLYSRSKGRGRGESLCKGVRCEWNEICIDGFCTPKKDFPGPAG